MTRKTPPKDQPGEQLAPPSISEQLGTDDPQEQAELIAAYRSAANIRPVVVAVYYDPRIGFIDVQPIGGDIPIAMIQEVLLFAQQRMLRSMQEQAQQEPIA